MSEELKPCPFCGGSAKIRVRKTALCECSRCKALFICRDRESVVSAWNTRNDRAVIDAFLVRVRERYFRKDEYDYQDAIDAVYAEMFPDTK